MTGCRQVPAGTGADASPSRGMTLSRMESA
jgi:hypothetical protein